MAYGKIALRIAIVMASASALAGCGGDKLQGKSFGGENCLYESVEFAPKQKVYLTQKLFGETMQIAGDYALDKERVTITANGQSFVFTLTKEGALDGGGMIGACTPLPKKK